MVDARGTGGRQEVIQRFFYFCWSNQPLDVELTVVAKVATVVRRSHQCMELNMHAFDSAPAPGAERRSRTNTGDMLSGPGLKGVHLLCRRDVCA